MRFHSIPSWQFNPTHRIPKDQVRSTPSKLPESEPHPRGLQTYARCAMTARAPHCLLLPFRQKPFGPTIWRCPLRAAAAHLHSRVSCVAHAARHVPRYVRKSRSPTACRRCAQRTTTIAAGATLSRLTRRTHARPHRQRLGLTRCAPADSRRLRRFRTWVMYLQHSVPPSVGSAVLGPNIGGTSGTPNKRGDAVVDGPAGGGQQRPQQLRQRSRERAANLFLVDLASRPRYSGFSMSPSF